MVEYNLSARVSDNIILCHSLLARGVVCLPTSILVTPIKNEREKTGFLANWEIIDKLFVQVFVSYVFFK